MAIIEVKCPNCGATISVEESRNASTCRRCGTSYLVREANRVKKPAVSEAVEVTEEVEETEETEEAEAVEEVEEAEETEAVEEAEETKEPETVKEEPTAASSKEDLAAEWRNKGLCQYCGGKFGGFFVKKCKECGKKKDY